jgi:23S rRNA A1618 N6-methylase RlmF
MTAVEAYSRVVVSKKKGVSKKKEGPEDDTIRANGPVVFDFCMTNPPFYAAEEEATVDRKGDGRSRTDMNVGEGVYPGGELGFVRDMVADSVELTDSITWYTSMVSKKSSLVELEGELRRRFGRGAVRTATFVQGKTTRWGIAWTHRQVAPRSPAVRVRGGLQEFDVEMPTADRSSCGALDEVASRVVSYCQWMVESKKLEMECTVGRKEDDIVEVVIAGKEQRDDGVCSATASGGNNSAFIIDVGIKAGEARNAEKTLVNLKLECYCHSSGMATIEAFRSGVVCEIKRSNRRWRRMLAKPEGA